jgi:transcriptional regulator with XRE-family HTH domain
LILELRKRIRASGLRYADIEERAGFSKKYLSQLLNGHVDLKLFQLFKILTALPVDLSEFFTAVARRYRRRPPTLSEAAIDEIAQRVVPQLTELIRRVAAEPIDDDSDDDDRDDRRTR